VEPQRWYVTGILLGFLALCLVILAVRWNVLAQRSLHSSTIGTVIAQASVANEQTSFDEDEETGGSPAGSSGALRLNLNSATSGELEQLPGIGPVLAQRIVQYRLDRGLFEDVSDLVNVEGIGAYKLAAIEDLLYVEPAD
jgi:competence ComEA-like helix-hairpin-helix protein